MSMTMKILDVCFSVALVVLAPVLAGYGFARFEAADAIGKVASLGLVFGSIMLFGIACMGFIRLREYTRCGKV